MKDETLDKLREIKDRAVAEIYQEFLSFIEEMNDYSDPKIHEFVDLFVSWYLDKKQKDQWLCELFHNIIVLDDTSIIWSLDHFIGYHLYDDGGYSVWWKTSEFADGTCTIVDEYHTEYVKGSYPVIKHDTDENHHQNVQLLIDIMNKKQELKLERIKDFEEMMRKYRSGVYD
jgi:hypothetical protein